MSECVCFSFLILWFSIIIQTSYHGKRLPKILVFGLMVSLGLWGVALHAGAHLLFLFFLSSTIFIPLMLHESLDRTPMRLKILLLISFLTYDAWQIHQLREQRAKGKNKVHATSYQLAANTIKDLTVKNEIVIAPWDDFPGLFAYNQHNRYVVGINFDFLLAKSPDKAQGFKLFWQGRIKDPHNLFQQHFDGARFVLFRKTPRNQGEKKSMERVNQSIYFKEISIDSDTFRLFQRIN